MGKKYKLVMLPTGDTTSRLVRSKDGGYIDMHKYSNISEHLHLYILDRKAPIDIDDYYISENDYFTTSMQVFNLSSSINGVNAMKIIASTNSKLGVYGIQDEFLKQIVETQIVPEWIELEDGYAYYEGKKIKNIFHDGNGKVDIYTPNKITLDESELKYNLRIIKNCVVVKELVSTKSYSSLLNWVCDNCIIDGCSWLTYKGEYITNNRAIELWIKSHK